MPGSLSPLSPLGLGLSPHRLGTEFLNGDNYLGRLPTSVPTVPTVLIATRTVAFAFGGALRFGVGV